MEVKPEFIDLTDIERAKQNLAGLIYETPTVLSESLSRLLDIELFFKIEALQKTGAFKIRGALNKLKQLVAVGDTRGVITISAGNHAAGVALAGSLVGIEATVVMPSKAVKSKVQAVKSYGGRVILHETVKELMAKCDEVREAERLSFIHPFDDPLIFAGQGTVGLEILDVVRSPDFVFVPVGGGGLISGVATAIRLSSPGAKIIGVEPVGAAVISKSLEQKSTLHLDRIDTIADGLAAPFSAENTLAHIQRYVDEMVTVTDQEIVDALVLILEKLKIVAEPAGAAAFAGLLKMRAAVPKGARVVCVLSGGNIDMRTLSSFISERRSKPN